MWNIFVNRIKEKKSSTKSVAEVEVLDLILGSFSVIFTEENAPYLY